MDIIKCTNIGLKHSELTHLQVAYRVVISFCNVACSWDKYSLQGVRPCLDCSKVNLHQGSTTLQSHTMIYRTNHFIVGYIVILCKLYHACIYEYLYHISISFIIPYHPSPYVLWLWVPGPVGTPTGCFQGPVGELRKRRESAARQRHQQTAEDPAAAWRLR